MGFLVIERSRQVVLLACSAAMLVACQTTAELKAGAPTATRIRAGRAAAASKAGYHGKGKKGFKAVIEKGDDEYVMTDEGKLYSKEQALFGSCKTAGGDICGAGPASGTCFCDAECEKFGDCCDDYAKVCGGGVAMGHAGAPDVCGPYYGGGYGDDVPLSPEPFPVPTCKPHGTCEEGFTCIAGGACCLNASDAGNDEPVTDDECEWFCVESEVVKMLNKRGEECPAGIEPVEVGACLDPDDDKTDLFACEEPTPQPELKWCTTPGVSEACGDGGKCMFVCEDPFKASNDCIGACVPADSHAKDIAMIVGQLTPFFGVGGEVIDYGDGIGDGTNGSGGAASSAANGKK